MIVEMIDIAVDAGARREQACEVVGLAGRTVEHWREVDVGDDGRAGPKTRAANAFAPAERAKVLEVVSSPEYRDLPPNQVVPRLADAGRYIGSESTIYRILRAEGQDAHRGRAKPRTVRTVDEHVATAANQVRSWDITYLLSAVRGRFYYLYMVEVVCGVGAPSASRFTKRNPWRRPRRSCGGPAPRSASTSRVLCSTLTTANR